MKSGIRPACTRLRARDAGYHLRSEHRAALIDELDFMKRRFDRQRITSRDWTAIRSHLSPPPEMPEIDVVLLNNPNEEAPRRARPRRVRRRRSPTPSPRDRRRLRISFISRPCESVLPELISNADLLNTACLDLRRGVLHRWSWRMIGG